MKEALFLSSVPRSGKLNIHRLFLPHIYIQCIFLSSAGEPIFFFFQGHPFKNKNTLLKSHLIALSDFGVPAPLRHVNAEQDTGKLCKGKFPFGFVQL